MSRTREGMVFIDAGSFRMGSADFYPEEPPVWEAHVDGFWIDEHPVTVGRSPLLRFAVAVAQTAPSRWFSAVGGARISRSGLR